ncbi:MAG: PAS domain S-box protein [Hoeflea sp.]|uniref:PAS domain-containing sensor histidine kinase n=1 Tax=Hoeflea sp. TaxID=1940281 RepID=UPI001D6686B1|nr:PAS domain S-box protein [Hoeflea sp.]MBU4530673.1 PAS domain S-box protein [Alphaproteobacteria bacterium]MBU4544893.1 PAS domain S-box protein [Alphaproteobacteria bacterium]MBU4552036.1 PAS domain S-box protein [Alphaproteobacteria bacterium]MBV1722225.1 PAS domain S-box protein [Hoeflea sp.]MBV1761787.1 PAS domain S-box protein [Hoeflea sp.]
MQLPAEILAKALYDTFPDPVLVTDVDGIIVAANQAAVTLLGYAEPDILGMEQAKLETSAEGLLSPGQTLSATEKEAAGWVRRNARLRCKDGRVLAVELSQGPLSAADAASAGTVMIVRDLTRLNQELKTGWNDRNEPEPFLRSALDSVSHGFAIYDPADRLVLCNTAYRTMHADFTAAIELGKTFEEILRETIESGRYPQAGSTPEVRQAWILRQLDIHNNPGEPYVYQISEDQWVQIEDRVTEDNYRVGLRADVTDLVRAKSEAERLGFILEGVAQEVYLVRPKDRSIIYANKAARDNLQYSMEELRGMDARDLNAEYRPEEISEKMQPLILGKTKVLQLDTRHRRKDGSIYVCRIRVQRMENAPEPMMLSLGEDITERLEIERALDRKQTEFESLVRSLPDLISRAHPDTTLTYVNENYARFTGCKAEDMVGRKFMEFIPPEMRPDVMKKISGLTPERPMKTLERQMQDHAGEKYWYSWTNLMVFKEGEPVELVSVGRDVTDSYQARERIAHQTQELAMRNDALEQFAGIVSHDLKAPLRQIRLFADMIAEDVGAGKTDELEMLSAHISDRGKAMEQMISSLLEYSQLAYRTIKPTQFNLSDAVAEAWSNLVVHASEAKARLTIESDAEINADFNLMVQLLQNLFANSMKYSVVGTPVVVRVDVETSDTEVSIAVADNGIGIDPAQAERIFGVFQRLHRDELQYSGSGLGLALCRRIAESHGGSIALDASFQRGARFVITLPKRGL